jgi:Lrp/AsnC family leucine-responsive transcriptional regulator
LDKLDYRILSELSRDPQIPFLEIAKKLGTSPYTVVKRYEKMKKEGIIKKILVSIDLKKLGYQGKVYLMITNVPTQDKSVTIEALEKINNIIVITQVIGAFDILAIAPITDLNSIRTLVKEIKKLPSVQRVEIACINDTDFPINPSFNKMIQQSFTNLANNPNHP